MRADLVFLESTEESKAQLVSSELHELRKTMIAVGSGCNGHVRVRGKVVVSHRTAGQVFI